MISSKDNDIVHWIFSPALTVLHIFGLLADYEDVSKKRLPGKLARWANSLRVVYWTLCVFLWSSVIMCSCYSVYQSFSVPENFLESPFMHMILQVQYSTAITRGIIICALFRCKGHSVNKFLSQLSRLLPVLNSGVHYANLHHAFFTCFWIIVTITGVTYGLTLWVWQETTSYMYLGPYPIKTQYTFPVNCVFLWLPGCLSRICLFILLGGCALIAIYVQALSRKFRSYPYDNENFAHYVRDFRLQYMQLAEDLYIFNEEFGVILLISLLGDALPVFGRVDRLLHPSDWSSLNAHQQAIRLIYEIVSSFIMSVTWIIGCHLPCIYVYRRVRKHSDVSEAGFSP